jgi:ABC-2 type transport system ATP-binding protein
MIEVHDVTRRYGSLTAVDRASFRIGAGEIVGFLGPNGAGKSTLLKMMSTYLPPTSGRITIHGHDTVRESLAARRALGYLPEHNALFDAMRVDRFLDFVARARGVTTRPRERFDWVVDRCSLDAVLAQPIRACSKGYRQRIGLAAALIHDPPVLLLDEPTHGLDPIQVVAFRGFIRELAAERAILFSSHILAEVATISDRLLVIQSGRIVLDAPTRELNRRAAEENTDLEALVLEAVQVSGKTDTL